MLVWVNAYLRRYSYVVVLDHEVVRFNCVAIELKERLYLISTVQYASRE